MSTFTITGAQNISALNRLGSVPAIAWTRSTTTATVTQNGHGLVNGDFVVVTSSSDTAAIVNGLKTVAGATTNTFTFTCLNAGAASGTLTLSHIDNFTVNGGYLTVDQDSRYGSGTNSKIRQAMGNITLNASSGGSVEFNATLVRIIPYDTGTGNVPAYDTVVSRGSASGLLIGVYSALNVAPTFAGSAMPASGFIKIRQWNSVAYAAGALTGISANATGADRAGWLEIVGAELGTMTVNRLNLFKTRGAWYEVGTCDGNRATTYQIPTNGSLLHLAGVWVETDVAGTYEFYPYAGTRSALIAQFSATDFRGNVCWISTAGLLRFGHDGTNSTGGYCPPVGRKIRVPNIFFLNATQAAPDVNVVPNATLATRPEFATAGGGVLDIEYAMFNWYLNIIQAYSLTMTNVGVMSRLPISEVASPMTMTQVGIGQEVGAASQEGLNLTLCFAGGTITDFTSTRTTATASGVATTIITDIAGFTFTRLRNILLAARGYASGHTIVTRASNCSMASCSFMGGGASLATCVNFSITDTTYVDTLFSTTPTTYPIYAFYVQTMCLNLTISGLSFGGLFAVQPYSGVVYMVAADCREIKIRNIGTYAAPLDMGGPIVYDKSWSSTGSVCTVTSVAHGLKAADTVYVMMAVNTSTTIQSTVVVVAAKTVVATPTADTFTFACTSTVATGTLTYFLQVCSGLYGHASSTAANGVKIQRCYCAHGRGASIIQENSSRSIVFESVYFDYITANSMTGLSSKAYGISGVASNSGQTAIYGTHWITSFLQEVPVNRTAVTWTAAASVAVVTSNNHKLRNGAVIVVTSSSNTGVVTLGVKTVAPLSQNTFSFPCAAGTTSGTIDFVPVTDKINVLLNEPTAATLEQVSFDAGAPKFTSAGAIYMPTIGDQVTWTTPDYLVDHNSFPIYDFQILGAAAATNYDCFYAIDRNDGNGFGAFKNLSYTRAGGGGSNASTNVTMADTTGVAVGDYVFGTNIAANAKVVSITNATTVVVDIANTGTVSGILRFNQLPSEAVLPTVGMKLKVRVKTVVANTTAITALFIYAESNDTTRARQYPLDSVTVSLTGLQVGSEVRAYVGTDPATAVEVGGIESCGASFTFSQSVAGSDGYIRIMSTGFQEFYLPITYSASNVSIPISQVLDRNYQP
jgi:hypothetical protein